MSERRRAGQGGSESWSESERAMEGVSQGVEASGPWRE